MLSTAALFVVVCSVRPWRPSAACLCHDGWDGWQRRRRAWRTRVRHTRHRSNLASVGQMRLGGWVGGSGGDRPVARAHHHDIRLSIYLSVSGRREGVWHVRPRTRCWIARSLCARAAPHSASLRSIGRPLALPSQSHPQQRGPLPDQTSRCRSGSSAPRFRRRGARVPPGAIPRPRARARSPIQRCSGARHDALKTSSKSTSRRARPVSESARAPPIARARARNPNPPRGAGGVRRRRRKRRECTRGAEARGVRN